MGVAQGPQPVHLLAPRRVPKRDGAQLALDAGGFGVNLKGDGRARGLLGCVTTGVGQSKCRLAALRVTHEHDFHGNRRSARH